MFACIYFVEDNSLTVVGQKSKRLQHLGQFKERENVKMTWGKDLFLGTIVKIHESEDYLTEFATKANAQILKKLKERPSEVPRELFTFDHISKTDGKRQHKETNKIKESRQQEKDFSPKKKSNLVSMQPKGKITEKQNSVDSTNPTIVNSQKRKVQEKSNLSTCNLLMSDIANQFENDSSVHYNEPSAKLTPDQCAESTGNFPLPSPVLQNLCSQLQLSASASTAREDEPPIYTPLTATWSLCTSTDRPDDSPGNLFSHPAPPPAILDLFEALCQPHIQNYLLQFVQHFRNPRPNASSFYQNETNYSENGTECSTQASLQSVQESGNGCQQPIQSSFYVANNCTSSQDLFVPSVQLECNPNPVNRQEPHSFPHSPASPRAASSPRRSPRKPKYQGDVSGVAQERDDDEDENEIDIVEDEKENRPIDNPQNTEKAEKLVPHREAIKIDLTTLHSHYRTRSLSSLPHVLTEYGLEDKTVRFQKRRKKKKRNNKFSDESEDEEAYRFQRSRRMEERFDEQVDFVEEVQKKVERQRQKMKLRQEAEQRKFEEFMRAESATSKSSTSRSGMSTYYSTNNTSSERSLVQSVVPTVVSSGSKIEKRHRPPKRLERKELTHDDGFIKNIQKSRVSKILALEAKMKNEGKLKTQTEIDNFWEDMKNPDIFNAYFTQPTITDNSSTITAMTGMTASNQSIVSNLAASHQESHPPRSLSHISERHDETPTPQTGRDKWAITQQFQHKHHSEANKHKRPTSAQIAKEAALDLEKRCPKLEMPPLWCFTMDLGEKPPDPEEIRRKVELKLREKNRKIFQRKLRKMHQLAMANSAAANRILEKRGDLKVLEGSTLRDLRDAFCGVSNIAYFNVDNEEEEEEAHGPSPVLPPLRPSERSQMVLAVTYDSHDNERQEVSIDKRGFSASTNSRPTSKKLSRGSKRSHHKTPEALPAPPIPYKPSPLTLNELEHTGKVMEAKCTSTLWVNYMKSGKSVFSQS